MRKLTKTVGLKMKIETPSNYFVMSFIYQTLSSLNKLITFILWQNVFHVFYLKYDRFILSFSRKVLRNSTHTYLTLSSSFVLIFCNLPPYSVPSFFRLPLPLSHRVRHARVLWQIPSLSFDTTFSKHL